MFSFPGAGGTGHGRIPWTWEWKRPEGHKQPYFSSSCLAWGKGVHTVTLIKLLILSSPQFPLLYFEENQPVPGPSWWFCGSVLGAGEETSGVSPAKDHHAFDTLCLTHLPPTTAVPGSGLSWRVPPGLFPLLNLRGGELTFSGDSDDSLPGLAPTSLVSLLPVTRKSPLLSDLLFHAFNSALFPLRPPSHAFPFPISVFPSSPDRLW